MSAEARSAPPPVVNLETLLGEARRRGLRLSTARRMVLAALFAAPAPVSAAQIAAGPGAPPGRLDLASVYRNLEALGRKGLVRRLRSGGGADRFALAATGDRDYVLCGRCGAVTAAEGDALARARAEIEAACGYRVDFGRFPLVGLCPACRG